MQDERKLKSILDKINRVKSRFYKTQKNFPVEEKYLFQKNDQFFLKKTGAMSILRESGGGLRVLFFPDSPTHKMGGDHNSIAYVGYLVDDKLMALILEYVDLSGKGEYESLKFLSYGEGRGACQFQEGKTYGPLNRSIKIAEGRCLVDTILNVFNLEYGQDEDYVENTPYKETTPEKKQTPAKVDPPTAQYIEAENKEEEEYQDIQEPDEFEPPSKISEEELIHLQNLYKEGLALLNTKVDGLYVIEDIRENIMGSLEQNFNEKDSKTIESTLSVLRKVVPERQKRALEFLKKQDSQV